MWQCDVITSDNDASGVPQGSVLGSILFVIYVKDLADNLTIDHLLYADDVKFIAPRK